MPTNTKQQLCIKPTGFLVVVVVVGAAIVLDLLCLFKGGLCTSSGLFEAGQVHFFGAIVLDCPNCFVSLALIWSDESVPVFGSPLSTPLSLFVLLILTNLPIFCCVSCPSTELLCHPDISHKNIPILVLVSYVYVPTINPHLSFVSTSQVSHA